MPKGGARPRSGPAPDPGSLRQLGKASDWTDLPARRDAPAPPWCAEPAATPRESALWSRYWEKPQAVIWERNGQHDEVAQFVRLLASVETGEATTAQGTLLRQLRGELLLTIPAMLSAKLRILGDETVTPRAAKKAAASKATSSRRRLAVVADASGE